ncbi:ZIP zinc transporter-domain-containing protein [Entophlyctis helioformis]|nr:ZIP zinc transporter-domain-containing protein [Entophlyctis helioformis]
MASGTGSLAWLLLLSASMLVGSFLAGNLPLAMSLSEERLRLVSTFGSGLLHRRWRRHGHSHDGRSFDDHSLANALIPRRPSPSTPPSGSSLPSKRAYFTEPSAGSQQSAERHASTLLQWHGAEPHNVQVSSGGGGAQADHSHDHSHSHLEDVTMPSSNGVPKATTHGTDAGNLGAIDNNSKSQQHRPEGAQELESALPSPGHSHSHESAYEPHKYIGPSLIAGFAFMFLVDQISTHSHPQSTSRIAVSELRDSHSHSHYSKKKTLSASVGLIVHAAADGIALGAASVSSTDNLGFIVFLAIMLHKAPSAFGFCTFLMQEGYTRRAIRQHLFVFSAAAPVAAIMTYLSLVQSEAANPQGNQHWTGVLLLFSAGTFLYRGRGGGHGEKSLSRAQIACLLAGFATPMILSIEVSQA